METNFRIFLWQPGRYIIKEVLGEKSYSDYEKLPKLNNPHIYLNKNYLPRFYFVENIFKVNNIEEAKETFLNENFDPPKSATVESYDKKRNKLYIIESNKYEITSYKNNSVILKVNLANDGFWSSPIVFILDGKLI